jgi:hypothetical protein
VSACQFQHSQPLGVLSLSGAKTFGADDLALNESDRKIIEHGDHVENSDAIPILETPPVTAKLANLRDKLGLTF